MNDVDVLLVEDSEDDAVFFPHALKEGGLTERVRYARDGMEVLQRLKTNPHTRTIPVGVWSSSREKRDLAAAYKLGANSYLVQPLDFDELTELIQTMGRYWLRHNQTLKV